MRGSVLIGCSGWQYRDWRGAVYPTDVPLRAWLRWYAERLPTVEINSSFYRLPRIESVAAWREQVPDDFVFAVKLGAFGTHRKKLIDPEWWLANHLERFEPLRERQGPTLVQLPPRWRRDTGRLDAFLSAAPRDMRWAVELRDPSWVHDDVLEVLHRHQAALCIHDLLADHPRVLTADWTYLRFHGPDALQHPYRGRYSGPGLRAWAEWIDEVRDGGKDVYGYFNNDVEAQAFTDCRRLTEMVHRMQHAAR
jgi:uncharacterized protein YecE (DUF72 family)